MLNAWARTTAADIAARLKSNFKCALIDGNFELNITLMDGNFVDECVDVGGAKRADEGFIHRGRRFSFVLSSTATTPANFGKNEEQFVPTIW